MPFEAEKDYKTGPQKTSYKYNIQMLMDDERKESFQLTISRKSQVLASLPENEQHLGEEENQTVVNQVWQGMKRVEGDMFESKQHKAYGRIDTLKKIEVRKKWRGCWTAAERTRAMRAEAQIR